jgi:PmbA protein
MSFITSMVERRDAKGSGYGASSHLAELAPYDAGREAAEGAIRQISGVRVDDGQYKIIFGPQAFMDILSNLIVPGLNLGLFYAASSPFQGKLGQRIASEKLSIYDDGAAPGLVASKGVTCEGLPTGRTELIRDGVLVGLMANWYESQRILRDPKGREKLGVDPNEYASAMVPRNGFRFGTGGGRLYERDPGISGTNIGVEDASGSGSRSLDDLAREVGDGLYIGRIWYTYPVNGLQAGDFTCTVIGDSYLIKAGRLAEPIKPNTIRINDNINNVLQNVIGIGSARRPALVWAADEVVHTPEVAVSGVHVQAIGGYMEQL